MFDPRNYSKRMSQLQQQGQSYAMQQRSFSHAMHQRVYTGMMFQQNNYYNKQTNQRNVGALMHHQYNLTSKMQFSSYQQKIPYGNSVAAAVYQHHQVKDNNRLAHFNRPSRFVNNNLSCSVPDTGRAVTRDTSFDGSLFPFGEPVPEDYLGDWDQRPECPRPKWTHPEKSSWQPSIKSRNGEYTGTELIQARDETAMSSSCSGINNFYKNLRPQPWQLVSVMDPDYKIISENTSSDWGRSDSSDCSSVKSGSINFDFVN